MRRVLVDKITKLVALQHQIRIEQLSYVLAFGRHKLRRFRKIGGGRVNVRIFRLRTVGRHVVVTEPDIVYVVACRLRGSRARFLTRGRTDRLALRRYGRSLCGNLEKSFQCMRPTVFGRRRGRYEIVLGQPLCVGQLGHNGIFNRLRHQRLYLYGVRKLHLQLARMHVNVHHVVRHGYVQHKQRILPLHKIGRVHRIYGVNYIRAFHISAVDYYVLIVFRRLRKRGNAGVARNGNRRLVNFRFNGIFKRDVAVNRKNGAFQALAG